jgi:predicted transcriptional regulator
MLPIYRAYMASEEGVVWGDYPADADNIIKGLTKRAGLHAKTVREMLDELKKEGRI